MPKNKKASQEPSLQIWHPPKNTAGVVAYRPDSHQKITNEAKKNDRSKAYGLIRIERKKFPTKGSVHNKEQQNNIQAHYAKLAFEHLPHISLMTLYRNYESITNKKSKEKKEKAQATNPEEWSIPELLEGICLCRPEENKEIPETLLRTYRRKAYRLIYNELRKFPGKANKHNTEQRKRIRSYYAQYAFENLPQTNLMKLYDSDRRVSNNMYAKKKATSRTTDSEEWSPPKDPSLVPVTDQPQEKSLSTETITDYKIKGSNLLRRILSDFPIKTGEISKKDKKNNEKKRKEINRYYETMAFRKLPHISVQKLAKENKKRYRKKAGSAPETKPVDPETPQESKRKKRRTTAYKKARSTPDKNHEMDAIPTNADVDIPAVASEATMASETQQGNTAIPTDTITENFEGLPASEELIDSLFPIEGEGLFDMEAFLTPRTEVAPFQSHQDQTNNNNSNEQQQIGKKRPNHQL